MKRISDKRAAQLADYDKLISNLAAFALYRTELEEAPSVWNPTARLEAHHIDGRRGDRLLDPFNIIIVTAEQHREIHQHNTWEQKQKLLALVKEIRLRQGFSQEGSGAIKELQEGE